MRRSGWIALLTLAALVLSLALLRSTALGAGGLRVRYRAANIVPDDDTAAPWFRIHNDGARSIALRSLWLRYWLTADTPIKDVAACDWASTGCGTLALRVVPIPPRDRADRYLEVRFSESAGSLAPGAFVELQLRFHKQDWSALNEANDYSFDPGRTQFADWERATLYRTGRLVWGIEPAGAPTPSATPSATPTLRPATRTPTVTPTRTQTPTPSPTASPSATPGGLCTASPWDPQQVYWSGDEVSHDDHEWRARWWTQGEEPGLFEVWQEVRPFIMPTPTMTPTPVPPGPWPAKVLAPYVDVNHYPPFSIVSQYNLTGQKYYTLAFILSGGGCTPAWGGTIPIAENHYMDQIATIRSAGGKVILSFGGAAGTELALACPDVGSLQAAYQQAIDQYHVDWIDLDIEGANVADPVSITRRNQAIAGLQETNPDLKVAYCLPALPSGLTQDGLDLLANAQAHGVRIDLVNVMAMDYGDGVLPDPDGHMGEAAIQAGQSTRSQLLNMGIDASIGITPMIGQNDVPSERFYLTDAELLVAWAGGQEWMGLLSFWSANRDNGLCPGNPWASPTCSGLEQELFAFTNVLKGFASGRVQAGGR